MAKSQEMAFNYVSSVTATIEFNEVHLRALDALVGYGFDGFIKMFYKDMGEHYMRPYEAGLRSFFKRVAETVPVALSDIDEMRDLVRRREDARRRGLEYGAYKPPHRPKRMMVEGGL